jgi:hypothetical protein
MEVDMTDHLISGDVAAISTAVDDATQFVSALFSGDDLMVVRPIESWDEAGVKQNRIDYDGILYFKPRLPHLRIALRRILKRAEEKGTNVYIGVCPRFGSGGKFDLAWQIRRLRAIWIDVDHATVDEVRERIALAGLPPPSIVVSSGHGVHVYWLLDEPYRIDDVGDPPPVELETVTTKRGPQRRKYIVEKGEKVYLDTQKYVLRLSPKALAAQEILAGIAELIGGDHTIDVTRLLRMPGSLNRKNQRNGKVPVPCTLVECEASRRYAWNVFERFAKPSVERVRNEKIAAMPLPKARRDGRKRDRLARYVAASAVADRGSRSEADFATVCFAVRNGVAKEELWADVQSIGKFAEEGRRYFDLTWDRAEFACRENILEQIEDDLLKPRGAADREPGTTSFDSKAASADSTTTLHDATIYVDSGTRVAEVARQMTECMLGAGTFYLRADAVAFVADHRCELVQTHAQLAGLLNQYVEFYFQGEKEGAYKPLPPSYGSNWLNKPLERARLPEIKLFTRNPVFNRNWDLVAPGHDRDSGIYYAGPIVTPCRQTTHLDALLRDFCFASPGDRTNYLGMLLTVVLMPHFIGSKPALLLSGNQPGLGKSILAQIIAFLRDGSPTQTISYNPNDEEFEKSLGAVVRSGGTTIIIDNAKSGRGKPKIESPCLERSITDETLAFRLLGHSSQIRAENSHVFCITANTPEVSRDLITRSVVVNLFHEGDPERRVFSIANPENYVQTHRLELLGELIGMVEGWRVAGAPQARVGSRFNKRSWGGIVGGILEACGEPDFLANAEEAAVTFDDAQREFAELIGGLAESSQGVWTAQDLVQQCLRRRLLGKELGEGSPRSQATRFGKLASRFLRVPFSVSGNRFAVLERDNGRDGAVYRVGITDELRNVGPAAERVRYVETHDVPHLNSNSVEVFPMNAGRCGT